MKKKITQKWLRNGITPDLTIQYYVDVFTHFNLFLLDYEDY